MPGDTVRPVDDAAVLDLLGEAAAAVRQALDAIDDRRPVTERAGQYVLDVVTDDVVVPVLRDGGVGVLSEESGLHDADRELVVVVDPVDGSTNASRGIPWYATSLCAVDEGGARVALVVNLATGERFDAIRGGGARRDGVPIRPSAVTRVDDAILALTGLAAADLGWHQFRALGAAALDLCAVACGRLDGWVDCTEGLHGPWDYLGGMLICAEAGAVVVDGEDRPLVTLEHAARRRPIAAATPELLAELRAVRGVPRPAVG
jgi:fructose-1,6-bisphosphatase/inositol monophosphatase family enzyme